MAKHHTDSGTGIQHQKVIRHLMHIDLDGRIVLTPLYSPNQTA